MNDFKDLYANQFEGNHSDYLPIPPNNFPLKLKIKVAIIGIFILLILMALFF